MAKVGFFDDLDLQILRGDEKLTKNKRVKNKVFSCADCGLNLHCQTSKFPVYGKGQKKILIILDTPSIKEDENGEPLSGPTGLIFKELLKEKLNISVKKDCWIVYAVRCCAKKNVKSVHVDSCRKYLHEDIKELKPNVIIPFGYWAMMAVSGDILTAKSKGKTIEDWTDFTIPDQRFQTWIVPTWDLYQLNLEQNKPDDVKINQLISHFQKAIELINKSVIKIDYEKMVEIITDNEKVLELLSSLKSDANIIKKQCLSIDYETTGMKPHRKGHEIISISISNGIKSWAFYYDNSNKDIYKIMQELLTHKNIYWIVHNVQFEWLWSFKIFGVWPLNLHQDTILGLHTLNSRKRKGLKPNVYCIFGVAGYDDKTEDYISAPLNEEKLYGANAFNLMKQIKKEDNLLYNGLDALFTFKIAHYINKNLKDENWIGYEFLMESAVNLVKAQENGIRVDTSRLKETEEKLSIQMNSLEKQIQKLAIKGGWNKSGLFRPSAPDDISELLFNIKGYESLKLTPAGKPSVDKEVLTKINDPIINPILEWKKLQKLKDTYLNGLIVEVVDNFMHPFFNLYTVVTYRSSSSNFNFQNIPKRDKFSTKIIRELLYPHTGQKLNEYDFKGIEVVTAACYCKDKNLIKYVSDPSTDMHRDTGIELFCYEDNPEDFQKVDRQAAKNKFVFPEFYGSYFEQCAPDLWAMCSPEAKTNMKKHGIKNIKDFTNHVGDVEYSFWHDRFSGYAEWKKDIYKFYLKHGYLDSLTGFRYYGPMKKNEALNICIQGSAHHVLLYLFNRISDVIKEKKLKSKLIGQIHDSMIPSIEPEEEKFMDKMIWYYGTQEIRNHFDWLIVPVEIEKSTCEIDRPWSEIKELGIMRNNGRIKE